MSPGSPRYEAGAIFYVLLETINLKMIASRDPLKTWLTISISLGLRSSQGRTLTEIANSLGITKQAISRDAVTFSRITGYAPAFGMKSVEARQTYQLTNGYWRVDE